MLEKKDDKVDGVEIQAMPEGGYLIIHGRGRDDYRFSGFIAAFSTLPEATKWIGKNVRCRESEPASK